MLTLKISKLLIPDLLTLGPKMKILQITLRKLAHK